MHIVHSKREETLISGMKKRRRAAAVIMIICILISCSSFSSFAVTKNTIRVPATQNYSEAQKVLKLINKQRTKRGLSSLKMDQALSKSAAKRAAELSIYIPETSPHKRPNGKLSKSINSKIIYECCAEGYGTPEDVVHGWMTSPSHKKGILLSNAKSVGIGCITTKNGTKFWTLEFSAYKAQKAVKSSKKVTSSYKISVLSTHLKKSSFSLSLKTDPDAWLSENIEVGDTVNACPFFRNNYDYTTQLRPSDYTWRSGKRSVATVDTKGKIKAKKAGKAVIYATMKNSPKYKLKFTIKVVKASDEDYYYD